MCSFRAVGGVADDVKVTQDSAIIRRTQAFAIRGSYIRTTIKVFCPNDFMIVRVER